tara:strand:+ start:31 stop:1032 length:1002 start_codon:yes stop_codon:yes gene_type:complete
MQIAKSLKSKLKNKSILLVGGNIFNQDGPVIEFIKICKSKKIKFKLITDREHLSYPVKNNFSFKKTLTKMNVKFKVLDRLTLKDIDKICYDLDGSDTIILSLNSIWFFNKSILKKYKNVFNYHNADLPTQRGAGCHSWRIMMNSFSTSINFHRLQSKIDQGPIILRKKINIPKYIINLQDYYNHIKKIEIDFFKKFLKEINKRKIKSKKQSNSKSFYFPWLKTKRNGYIDWSWDTKHILTFSHAFDKPFQGISTFHKGKKINLKKAKFVDKKVNFHPFQYGLVYRKLANKIYVATKSGGISFEYSIGFKHKIKLGDRLYTDLKSLYYGRALGK